MKMLVVVVLLAVLAASSSAQPNIFALQNNYSYILPGLPDYGIAQGSIFVMYGTNMGPAQTPVLADLSQGPLTADRLGVTVQVAVNGTTVQALPYYVSATQIAAILPSNTPAGTGTIRVSYDGQTSAPAPIKVVVAAFGILTLTGNGSGTAAAFDAANGNAYLGPAAAANPGDVITLWGTGLGASEGDETRYPFPQTNLKDRVQVRIGEQLATVQYAGRSQYPGLDQINVIVPPDVSGCYVRVEVESGGTVSNLAVIPVANIGRVCADPPVSYSSKRALVENAIEEQLFAGQQHFMTILLDANNAMIIRPHPGLDVNGWGSSLYLEPFLAGAILHGTTLQSLTTNDDGVHVVASGVVSQGQAGSYGTWTGDFKFSYVPGLKQIKGSGSYNIALSGALSSSTGDLNLYRLASNYLVNVPLLGGGNGNTGDMAQVTVSGGSNPGFSWLPFQGSTYPQDNRNPLSVEMIGNYNQVDTAAQGYAAIVAAYKPSMTVGISCLSPTQFTLIFGGAYDTSKSQQYWEDNVAVTPLVLYTSTAANYSCAVTLDSTAIAGDH